MTILVTGGAGYVGSVLVPMLLHKGHDVRVLDIMKHGVQPLFGVAYNSYVEIMQGSVCDGDTVERALDGVDVVMHLAAVVGYPACAASPQEAKRVNVDGTRQVMSRMTKDQVIVFASTGSVYEKVEGYATEEHPTEPLSLYGQQKVQCENMIRNSGQRYVILRFATLFGLSPRMRLDLMINDFVYKAVHQKHLILYEGHFRCSFLHVEDACQAYLLMLTAIPEVEGQILNVGFAEMTFSKRSIAVEIRKYVDYYLHEATIGQDIDQRDYAVDYSKIQQLGFEQCKHLGESIQRMVNVLGMLQEPSVYRNA